MLTANQAASSLCTEAASGPGSLGALRVLGEEGGDGGFLDLDGLVEAEVGDGLGGGRVGIGCVIALDAEAARELEQLLQLALGAGQLARRRFRHIGLRSELVGLRHVVLRSAAQGSRAFSTTRLRPKSIAPRKMPTAMATTSTTTVRLAVSCREGQTTLRSSSMMAMIGRGWVRR